MKVLVAAAAAASGKEKTVEKHQAIDTVNLNRVRMILLPVTKLLRKNVFARVATATKMTMIVCHLPHRIVSALFYNFEVLEKRMSKKN